MSRNTIASKLLSFAIAFAATLPLVADTWLDPATGYSWQYQIINGAAEISDNGSVAVSPKPISPLFIPATLGGKPVTSLGEKAFAYCREIPSVTIPEGVKNIGPMAFLFCSNMSEVTIPDSVTSIGDKAFYGCSAIRSVIVPQYICDGGIFSTVFSDTYQSITSLTISCEVTNIGNSAFQGCDGLTSVAIPNGVTGIGNFAFSGCSGLESLKIPDSVESIGVGAFSYCIGLKSLTIPDGVKVVRDSAFSGCINLTSVTISNGVTSIGAGIFSNCPNLMDVVLPKWCKTTNPGYDLMSEWKNYLGLPEKANVTYGDNGRAPVGTVPDIWRKSHTLKGVATLAGNPSDSVQGVFELKCGRPGKDGVAKVSAVLTGLDGKKKVYKEQFVDTTAKPVMVTLDRLKITIDGETFTGRDGSIGGMSVRSAEIGGMLTKGSMKFNVDIDKYPYFGTVGEMLEESVPKNVTAKVVGKKKLDFGRVATLKYVKNNLSGKYELQGFDDPDKPNVSALKLSYNSKTGVLRGNFKVYVSNAAKAPEGKSPKLRKFMVNVLGFVVDGTGYGQATLRRPAAGPWRVTVE